MNFIRAESENARWYPEAMALYRMSFPGHEQREPASQRAILQDAQYHFNLVFDGDTFVGILLYWEAPDFVYVEHFCIQPELRSKKYGQRVLELLNAQAASAGQTVILEIDPPVDDISRRRKLFYERVQYCENPFAHVHPPYHRGNEGHVLVVMSYPAPLTEPAYRAFERYLRQTVMGR